MPFANLNTAWFALIGLLWAGYLFLEGFDFGVALAKPIVSRDDDDHRLCLNAIGPVWDGNEVWLIVAGGATFAAFPLWYARLFSGFYLALFLVLIALIARGVSFEFRAKTTAPRWRRTWDVANFVGSLVPALVWGVAFTDLAHGIPLSPGGRYDGGLLGLLHPIALLGGVAGLCVFVAYGALFLSLKTSGDLAARARRLARWTSVLAAVVLAATVSWVAATGRPAVDGQLSGTVPLVFGIAALLAIAAASLLVARGRDGWAFGATGATVLLSMGAVFCRMFPSVMPASNRAVNGLTIAVAASKHETLLVMTVVAAIFTPIVLAYQGWTYWVFRQRLIRPMAPAGGGPPAGGGGTGGRGTDGGGQHEIGPALAVPAGAGPVPREAPGAGAGVGAPAPPTPVPVPVPVPAPAPATEPDVVEPVGSVGSAIVGRHPVSDATAS